jgi:uncharacterized repeat protein (TIGR02543 family)
MPNTAHEYNNDFTIGLNSYMKTTKIIYRARKGTYSDPKDWAENSNENVTIIRQGIEEREIKLNHTLDGWKYNNATTLPAGYTNSFSQLKTDLGLNNLEDLAFYGDMIELDAQWQTNKVKLPTMYREGFTFLGWFTEEENGERVGDENGYFSSDIKEITLYAHWEPIGLVQIYTGNKW